VGCAAQYESCNQYYSQHYRAATAPHSPSITGHGRPRLFGDGGHIGYSNSKNYSDLTQACKDCSALSGSHHAAGKHQDSDKRAGWWNHYIGPGKAIDTNHFFVISPNNLGGCHGSTGPASINPASGEVWGSSFPTLRVRDWVHSQARLADALGIQQWAAVIGGSLGGMQAMRWALEYPERLRHSVVIASSMKLTAQNIAFNETARQAIMSDPDFCGGDYLAKDTLPKQGLSVADDRPYYIFIRRWYG